MTGFYSTALTVTRGETPQEGNTALGELTLFSQGNSKDKVRLRTVSQQLEESGWHTTVSTTAIHPITCT